MGYPPNEKYKTAPNRRWQPHFPRRTCVYDYLLIITLRLRSPFDSAQGDAIGLPARDFPEKPGTDDFRKPLNFCSGTILPNYDIVISFVRSFVLIQKNQKI